MLGGPLNMIQEILGHSTMKMTMRAAHLAPGMKKHAAQLLDTREVSNDKGASQQPKNEGQRE